MYLGYFTTDIGFLLTNFGLQNMIVYACQFAPQVVRQLFSTVRGGQVERLRD